MAKFFSNPFKGGKSGIIFMLLAVVLIYFLFFNVGHEGFVVAKCQGAPKKCMISPGVAAIKEVKNTKGVVTTPGRAAIPAKWGMTSCDPRVGWSKCT
jgi:hypothetical protein